VSGKYWLRGLIWELPFHCWQYLWRIDLPSVNIGIPVKLSRVVYFVGEFLTVSFKLWILLLQPECWDYRHATLHLTLFYQFLRDKYWNLPTIILDSIISLFTSISFCFMNFETLWSTCTFKITIYMNWPPWLWSNFPYLIFLYL
jgi:hypothetical protein